MFVNNYQNNQANLTLIILFSKMLKFSKKKTLKENKKSNETFENMSFIKMESSTLINY